MSIIEAMSERAIILAPLGRDSQIALMMLNEAGFEGIVTRDLATLCSELVQGAGLLVIASEALIGCDLDPLLHLIEQQPAWSDLPIVLLTHHGGPEQNPASRLGPQLGNVTFLERPFHPVTLISLVTTALRGRRRQYEARDRLIDLSQSELRLQNTLETLEQQVEERTAQLRHNEEALRQSQKMEAVGQLTGGIAHDFNNMLTGIIGSLELLRRRLARGRTEDLDGLIDLGVTSANRAAGLTHRLLAFSRRQSLDSKPVEMNTLVVSMGELLQRSINESIQLDMQLTDELWIAEADPNQLESALLNLVLNARDAMPEGGKLMVETSNQHLDQRFHCGLRQSAAWRLRRAERHRQRLRHAAKHDQPGLRSLLYHQTDRPGHRAWVVDDLRLQQAVPRSRHDPQRSGSGHDREPVSAAFQRRSGRRNPIDIQRCPICQDGETVLIVEDDPAVRVLVSAVLSELGYGFVEAGDADSAVPIIESDQRIDLLISDVGLPGMNGRQLAEIGRQYRPDLKVLFITGYAEHAAVRGGFLDPGMQMITKPFTFDLLTAKVREMISIIDSPAP